MCGQYRNKPVLESTKVEPVEQQENTVPVQKDTAGDRAIWMMPGKKHGAKRLLVLSKPALHCVSKVKPLCGIHQL